MQKVPKFHSSTQILMVQFSHYVLAAAAALSLVPVGAFAAKIKPAGPNGPSSLNFINPYTAGKSPYANKGYATKLEETISYFNGRGDTLNAARTRTVQRTPTFRWLSHTSNVRENLLSHLDAILIILLNI